MAGALERVDGDDTTPPLPDDVRPTPEEVHRLRDLASRYVRLEGRELVGFGRAFMPAVPEGRPIMDRVPLSELLTSPRKLQSGTGKGSRVDDLGSVFLSFRQDLNGFTLGLGSSKVMAELILGEEPSVDMSPFRLPHKKDARCLHGSVTTCIVTPNPFFSGRIRVLVADPEQGVSRTEPR